MTEHFPKGESNLQFLQGDFMEPASAKAAPVIRYVAIQKLVMRGTRRMAEAVTSMEARRIAKAMNIMLERRGA